MEVTRHFEPGGRIKGIIFFKQYNDLELQKAVSGSIKEILALKKVFKLLFRPRKMTVIIT